MDAELLKEAFEKIGISDISFQKTDEKMHFSKYAVGRYHGDLIGIRFGRKVRIYEHEASGLSRLSHEGVPRCYDFGELKTAGGSLGYMIVQHFPGTALGNALNLGSKDGKEKAVRILTDIVDVIDYIHSEDVVHCDVTPDHVIVGKGVHLIDFHLWSESPGVPPTADFCGWWGLPDIIEEELYAKPRLLTMEQAEANYHDFSGYGRLLRDVTPSGLSDAFIEGLDNLAKYLTERSMRFVEHPKSRDVVSRNIRQHLKDIPIF